MVRSLRSVGEEMWVKMLFWSSNAPHEIQSNFSLTIPQIKFQFARITKSKISWSSLSKFGLLITVENTELQFLFPVSLVGIRKLIVCLTNLTVFSVIYNMWKYLCGNIVNIILDVYIGILIFITLFGIYF